MKQCSKCLKVKSPKDFHKDKNSKDGLHNLCKLCNGEKTRAWRLANPERARATFHKWYAENVEKVCESARQWAAKNPEKRRGIRQKWARANKEKIRAKNQRLYAAHPEKVQEWQKTHPEQVSIRNRKWRISNPGKCREYKRNRRAREASGGKITDGEWNAVLDRYDHKCLFPGCEITDVEMDHVIPLARGGTHTVDNVQPLCRRHNRSKGAKSIDYRPETELRY